MATNDTYVEQVTVNGISRFMRLALLMVLFTLALVVATVVPVVWSGNADYSRWTWGVNLAVVIPLIIGMSILGVIIHESLHGLFFWLYGRSAQFGCKLWTKIGPVFFATSRGNRFTRWQYVQISLAPQLLTLGCLLAVTCFHLPAVLWFCLLAVAAQNLSGGTFDGYAIVRVLRLPKGAMVEDVKDGWKVYLESGNSL